VSTARAVAVLRSCAPIRMRRRLKRSASRPVNGEHKGPGRVLKTSTRANGKGERVTCQMSQLSTRCSIHRATSDRPPTHQRVRKSGSRGTVKIGGRLGGFTGAAFRVERDHGGEDRRLIKPGPASYTGPPPLHSVRHKSLA